MKHIKEKILGLRNQGKTYLQIRDELNISTSTVFYYLKPDYREKIIKKRKEYFKNLPEERKKECRQKQKDYQRKYHYEKYHNDEVFREKHKARNRKT